MKTKKKKKSERTQLAEVLSRGWLFIISLFKKKSLRFPGRMLFSPIQAGQSQSSGRKKRLLLLGYPIRRNPYICFANKWAGKVGLGLSLFYFDTSRTRQWEKETKHVSIRSSATISWREKRCQKGLHNKIQIICSLLFPAEENSSDTLGLSAVKLASLLKRLFPPQKKAVS